MEDNKSNEQGEISSNYQMMGMSMGMCFGVALGLAFGNMFFEHGSIGMCFGIPVGMLLGMLAGAAKEKKVNGQPVY